MRSCMTSARRNRSRISHDLIGHRRSAADQPPPIAAVPEPFGDRKTDGLERRQIGEQLIDLEGARDAEPHALMRPQRRDVAPSSMMRPAVGRSTPVSRLIIVVLPAPFGPIRAWRAPFSIDERHVVRRRRCRRSAFPGRSFQAPAWFTALRRGACQRGAASAPRSMPRQRPTSMRTRQRSSCADRARGPTRTITTSTRPIQNCQYCGVRLAS